MSLRTDPQCSLLLRISTTMALVATEEAVCTTLHQVGHYRSCSKSRGLGGLLNTHQRVLTLKWCRFQNYVENIAVFWYDPWTHSRRDLGCLCASAHSCVKLRFSRVGSQLPCNFIDLVNYMLHQPACVEKNVAY